MEKGCTHSSLNQKGKCLCAFSALDAYKYKLRCASNLNNRNGLLSHIYAFFKFNPKACRNWPHRVVSQNQSDQPSKLFQSNLSRTNQLTTCKQLKKYKCNCCLQWQDLADYRFVFSKNLTSTNQLPLHVHEKILNRYLHQRSI